MSEARNNKESCDFLADRSWIASRAPTRCHGGLTEADLWLLRCMARHAFDRALANSPVELATDDDDEEDC
jgi:hypothetical protein